MSASHDPSPVERARPLPEGPRRAASTYAPTWWEKRFPWLLGALAALDPAPLARRFAVLLVPGRWLVETLVLPLALVLDALGRSLTALRSGLEEGAGAVVARLPLPRAVRRWLWLAPAGPVPLYPSGAQPAFRRQYRMVLPLALMLGVGLHATAFVLAPPMSVADFSIQAEELLALELPPEIEIPPPPRAIARPAVPVIATAAVDEDITIAPTTFDDYTVADLPPPPQQVAVEEQRTPTFTPFTVAPRVLNADLIEELMAMEYPPLLREAGIGGTVVVWAYIDREGAVEEVQLARSSGHGSLDEAGLRVAQRIRTSPALNRDVTIPVWVQLPLEFEVR